MVFDVIILILGSVFLLLYVVFCVIVDKFVVMYSDK